MRMRGVIWHEREKQKIGLQGHGQDGEDRLDP